LIRLAEDADVLIENYRPSVKKKLKIDYDTLKAMNPRLIYCSISGFGQTGPYAERAGFDPIAQGMSGIASITGWKHTGPVRVGVAIGDSLGEFSRPTGFSWRLSRGNGPEKDSGWKPLFSKAHLCPGVSGGEVLCHRERPEPLGNDHGMVSPYGTFKTKDGFINIAGRKSGDVGAAGQGLGTGGSDRG